MAAAAAATARRPEFRIQIRPVTGQCMPDSAPITTRVSRPELARRRARPSLPPPCKEQEQWTVNTKYSESDASPRPTLTKPTLFFVHTAAFGSGTLFVFVRPVCVRVLGLYPPSPRTGQSQ